jgi:hypothetical protein
MPQQGRQGLLLLQLLPPHWTAVASLLDILWM